MDSGPTSDWPVDRHHGYGFSGRAMHADAGGGKNSTGGLGLVALVVELRPGPPRSPRSLRAGSLYLRTC